MVKENERFFDSFEYSEAEFAAFTSLLRLTGVDRLIYEALAVNAPGGMNIQVRPGAAYVEGFHFLLDTPTTLAVDANDDDVVRRDYVVVRVQRNLNNFRLFVNKGTPAPTADPPDLERSLSYYDIVLAYIDVPIGVGAITTGMIHDARANPSLCGWTGYGVFPDFLTMLGDSYDLPGVTFATGIHSGMGWDNRSHTLLFYVDESKPLHLVSDAILAYETLYTHFDPELASPYGGYIPRSTPSGGLPRTSVSVYETQIHSWDRRFQMVLGRSLVYTISGFTDRYSLGQWAFRVGGPNDNYAQGAFEIYDLNKTMDLAVGGSIVRPDVLLVQGTDGGGGVPFGIDAHGKLYLNYLLGAVNGSATHYHRVSIGSQIPNESALYVSYPSVSSVDTHTISLVPNIQPPPETPVDYYPTTKRAPAAPNGSMGLLYGDEPVGQPQIAGIHFFIGPEGATANGIIMDYQGYVGIGLTPAFPFDVEGHARFAKSVNVGTSLIEGEVSLQVRRDAIFYGDVNFRGRLTFGEFGAGSGVTFPFDVVIEGKLTVDGDTWLKSDLRVDQDVDLNGFVRFNGAPSTSPWSFIVTGDQHNLSQLRVDGSVQILNGSLYFGLPTDNTVGRILSGAGQAMQIHGTNGIRFWRMDHATSFAWDDNLESDPNASGNPSIGGLGRVGSRWTRLYSIFTENCTETGGSFALAHTGAFQVEESDGSQSSLPGAEIIGLRPYTPTEGLAAALATPITTYFVSPSSAIVTETSSERRQALMEASNEMHLNVMGKQAPPEITAPGGGVSTLSTALVAIAAAQALERKNQDLEQRLSTLEQLVASLIPPAQV